MSLSSFSLYQFGRATLVYLCDFISSTSFGPIHGITHSLLSYPVIITLAEHWYMSDVILPELYRVIIGLNDAPCYVQ